MWIDSHTHINDEAFKDDLDQVLENMISNDVRKAMIISLNKEELEIARKINHPEIIFKRSIGIFPTDAFEFNREKIEDIYKEYYQDDIDAIGEIGLDYYWDKDHHDIQKEIFIEQLKIAKELNKPVIIHSRDAAEDTFNILKNSNNKVIMHCYSGSLEMAKEYQKLGFYISIAGTVTFKNARVPLEVAKNIDINKLLIETDCPYLTPVPFRGKRNEPAYVMHTGKFIAENIGMDINEFQMIIEKNYKEAFSRV